MRQKCALPLSLCPRRQFRFTRFLEWLLILSKGEPKARQFDVSKVGNTNSLVKKRI